MSEVYYFTERQKETAERTNLVEFLHSQGEMLKPSGTEWEWLCCGQKVTIRGNLWYHQYEQVGGASVSFVRKFMGMSYVDAVEYLLQYNGEPLPERSRKEKKPFELPPPNENMNRVFGMCQVFIGKISFGESQVVMMQLSKQRITYRHSKAHRRAAALA